MKQIISRCVTLAAALGLGFLGGCDGVEAPGAISAESGRQPVHVDSLRPIEEDLARFRAGLADPVEHLSGGASSREALIADFLAALEDGDRGRLAELTITPAEFAYLYYPSTRFTTAPYELSPGLLWFQLQNHGSRGLDRALRQYGSKPLKRVGHVCAGEPDVEGENRVWNDCVVRIRDEAGDTLALSLFGAILERKGRYKFISYANKL